MNTSENNRQPRAGNHRGLTVKIGASLVFASAVAIVLATIANGERSQPAGAQPVALQEKYPPAVKPRRGHSEYLVGLTRKALREGFGKEAVLLLQPGRGPGRDAVVRQLMAVAARRGNPFGPRITAAGLQAARTDKRNTAFVGPNSSLKVSADGTRFRFRGNIDDPRELERARASGRMIEKDELEKIGRNFIKEALRDFVKLGSEESLTFLGAKYLRDESISPDGKSQEEVVASIAIFGREVRGVPVIGGGSKVAIWFANDRKPVGFDVDWPVYQPLRTRQGVLARGQLFERVRATAIAPEGSGGRSVERFECGYVDLGASKRGAGVQAGCAIHYASRNDDGTLTARVEYVPAGDKVFEDPKWPLATLIARGMTINTDTPEFIKYASTTRAPNTAPVQRPPRGRRPRPTRP